MSNKTLVIYLKDDSLKQELVNVAKNNGTSLSDYVVTVLKSNLSKQPKNKLLKFAGTLSESEAIKIQEAVSKDKVNKD